MGHFQMGHFRPPCRDEYAVPEQRTATGEESRR
jgi:hypothetical protein